MSAYTLRQHIIFDMDDTLIHCNKYFEMILSRFTDIMLDWFQEYRLTGKEIRDKQIEIDVAGVLKSGFASKHFPLSLIETYHYFSRLIGRPIQLAEENHLMELGLSVYEQEIEPYPGMVETLEVLTRQGHELILYTGGEQAIQQRKIEQMKLAAYFQERIYIRQHKNQEALEQILSSRHFDRDNTWMIGNSLRTDIIPALAAGINTIYIKLPNEWAYNVVELKNKPSTAMYTVSSLEEVPDIIAQSISVKPNTNKRTL
ncbi:HAD family hydrolase [Paenibacillus tuaregi]|uniref:HAD family hydrolase n=1 Tax=Paenibacillus tuaregi TaxID=1816681 RepID=UPI000A823A45